MCRSLYLVKLGGSLITDKRRAGSVKRSVISRLAGEIREAAAERRGCLVLGHGSGSFGHAAAHRWGFLRAGSERVTTEGIAQTQNRAAELHREVVGALLAAGAEPFSHAPSSAMLAADGKPVGWGLEPLLAALARGLLPVVYGDVVLDRRRDVSICSTETIFLALVRALRRRGYPVCRAVWCGATAGLLNAEGESIPLLEPGRERAFLSSAGGAEGWDVTGGMRHRIETALALARMGVESWIVDGREPGVLGRALAGKQVPGTLIAAKPVERAGRR